MPPGAQFVPMYMCCHPAKRCHTEGPEMGNAGYERGYIGRGKANGVRANWAIAMGDAGEKMEGDINLYIYLVGVESTQSPEWKHFMAFKILVQTLSKRWRGIFTKKASISEGNTVQVVPAENGAERSPPEERKEVATPISTQSFIHRQGAELALPGTIQPGISNGNGEDPLNIGTRGPSFQERETFKASRQMFGDNILIQGGEFVERKTVIVNYERAQQNLERVGFTLLQNRIAPSAFHSSAQRIDPPRCHPDTRVEVMETIYDWIIKSDHRQEWLLWLNGAAGSGKSAIMQSIAERCVVAGVAIASFFFIRSDDTRNTMAPFIATLVYQLIQAIPETSNDIILVIERNPLLFDQSIELQLQQLIIEPLLRLPKDLQRLFFVFVDGLDECIDLNHQSNLIKVLSNISGGRNIPIIFLVASRRETQIETSFEQIHVSNLLFTLPLDKIQASDDIRRFLNAKFTEIKTTHLRRQFLPVDWPTRPVVEHFVRSASGQFIYASVVINYISLPHAHPAVQLDVIKGIRPRIPSADDPFANLDSLYRHIFAQVKDIKMVLDILALNLLTNNTTHLGKRLKMLDAAFQFSPGELEVYLSDLAAVITCEPRTNHTAEMKFLHASLPDFLTNKSRSEKYHIDVDEYKTQLLCIFLERSLHTLNPCSSTHDFDVVSYQEFVRLHAIWALLRNAKASERFHNAFMNFSYSFCNTSMVNDYNINWHCRTILELVKRLDFGDQGQAYCHTLDVFAAGYAEYWSSVDDEDKDRMRVEFPDLLARITQIIQE